MKVAIVGSRNYHDLDKVTAYVKDLPQGTVIVSGGARGVDSRAARAAREAGLEVVEHIPDWSQGKGAGFTRNSAIVADADAMVAFWDGNSHGTRDSINKARRRGIPVEVIT